MEKLKPKEFFNLSYIKILNSRAEIQDFIVSFPNLSAEQFC